MPAPILGRIIARLIRATLVALAVFVLPVGTAHAQSLFWPHYRSWWGDHAPFRHKHQHRHTKSDVTKNAKFQDAPKGPLQIIISIADQRISLYDNAALIARSSVSTGVEGHPTPLGVFSVISKQRWHRSNIYSAAPMPYMQRVTWSGIALHAGVLPGYPASHGCIRLTNAFAIQLWHLTKRGTRVIIAHDDVRPVEIANPHLFESKPKVASGSSNPQAASVAGNGIITAAKTYAPSMSNVATQEAANLQVPDSAPAGVAPQKVFPISVFVSRKLSKLFVRKGFTPLFDISVTIKNPAEPLGTHVFTAMEFPNESKAIRWTVVSMPEELPRTSADSIKGRKTPAKRTVETAPPMPSTVEANAALDRIEIPQDVVERISELLTPGSSLIVSDYGISDETGKDTDFIVITH
jgi:L,D-transpeptidase catalytic domain